MARKKCFLNVKVRCPPPSSNAAGLPSLCLIKRIFYVIRLRTAALGALLLSLVLNACSGGEGGMLPTAQNPSEPCRHAVA